MLSYEAALEQILTHTPGPVEAPVRLEKALGCVLAKPIVSAIDLPGFHNSAVDGYAVCAGPHAEADLNRRLRIAGEAQAGKPFPGLLRSGQAVRIFTGAAIPLGANAVVMQEHVEKSDEAISVAQMPELGRHIRRRGEDVKAGQTVLEAGRKLRSQELALLAAIGLAQVPVWRKPTVAVLTTGSELRAPGSRLAAGQIYNSNRVMIAAQVHEAGAQALLPASVPDQLSRISAAVRKGLASDVLVLVGGVSVGDKDLCRSALERCGVRALFWKVNIKPGMPLFFGKKGRTLVFGLPGNPVSAHLTFQEFVAPALAKLLGLPVQDRYNATALLEQELSVSKNRETHFVRVTGSGHNGSLKVTPVGGQGSHQLGSLAHAHGWIRVRSSEGPLPAGTRVALRSERVTP